MRYRKNKRERAKKQKHKRPLFESVILAHVGAFINRTGWNTPARRMAV